MDSAINKTTNKTINEKRDSKTDKKADGKTNKKTDGKTDRRKDKKTDKRADKKTDKKTNGSGRILFRVILTVSGGLLTAESAFASMLSNMNLGIIMPLIIGLPLVFIGIFYKPLRKWQANHFAGRLFKWCFIGAYVLFALMLAVTAALILVNSKEPGNAEADAVIVLGAGIRGNTPSITLKNRLDRAVEYHKEYPRALIIVSGGMGGDEIRTEASVMKEYLAARGVPGDIIIEENASTSTEENFRFSYTVIREKIGVGADIAFITTKFHVFRAKLIAQKQGMEVFGLPARGYSWLVLNNYLRECAAIVQNFLTGKI